VTIERSAASTDDEWVTAWQVEINGSGPDSVLVKHRHHSGANATKANARPSAIRAQPSGAP